MRNTYSANHHLLPPLAVPLAPHTPPTPPAPPRPAPPPRAPPAPRSTPPTQSLPSAPETEPPRQTHIGSKVTAHQSINSFSLGARKHQFGQEGMRQGKSSSSETRVATEASHLQVEWIEQQAAPNTPPSPDTSSQYFIGRHIQIQMHV